MDFSGQRDYVNQNNPFMTLCGITVTEVAPDRATAVLTASPALFNPGGTLHGGAFYTLADAVATTAARTDGCRYATTDGAIRYHRAVTQGTVTAAATVRHRGRSLCAVAVELTGEDGRLLADATFSCFRLAPIDHPAFRQLDPPKP